MPACGDGIAHFTYLPGSRTALGPGSVLGAVVVVMVVVVMMVPAGSERRTGKDHQQQGKGKNLFHEPNISMMENDAKENERRRIKIGTGRSTSWVSHVLRRWRPGKAQTSAASVCRTGCAPAGVNWEVR
jgi:hypothetical protein